LLIRLLLLLLLLLLVPALALFVLQLPTCAGQLELQQPLHIQRRYGLQYRMQRGMTAAGAAAKRYERYVLVNMYWDDGSCYENYVLSNMYWDDTSCYERYVLVNMYWDDTSCYKPCQLLKGLPAAAYSTCS
jgi:hypothetical protein